MEEKRLFSFWTVYSLCMKTKCMQISGTNAHGAAVCSLCDCVRGVMCSIIYYIPLSRPSSTSTVLSSRRSSAGTRAGWRSSTRCAFLSGLRGSRAEAGGGANTRVARRGPV